MTLSKLSFILIIKKKYIHVFWLMTNKRRIRGFVQNLLILYNSLIYPYLPYRNIVWANTFPTYSNIYVAETGFFRLATFLKAVEPKAPLFF